MEKENHSISPLAEWELDVQRRYRIIDGVGTVVIGDYFGLSKPDYGFLLIAKGKAKMDYTFVS